MLEVSRVLGWLGAALLFAASAAWFKQRRGALLQRLNGRAASRARETEGASRVLIIALAVSAVAAVVAVTRFVLG